MTSVRVFFEQTSYIVNSPVSEKCVGKSIFGKSAEIFSLIVSVRQFSAFVFTKRGKYKITRRILTARVLNSVVIPQRFEPEVDGTSMVFHGPWFMYFYYDPNQTLCSFKSLRWLRKLMWFMAAIIKPNAIASTEPACDVSWYVLSCSLITFRGLIITWNWSLTNCFTLSSLRMLDVRRNISVFDFN